MQPTRLNLPARKFFVKDLQRVTKRENDTGITNLSMWDASALDLYPEFSIAWVQGEISNVIKNPLQPVADPTEATEFTLDDETAQVLVIKPRTVPSGCLSLTQGRYVMVVGELQTSGPRPVIRAMKIQDLTGDTLSRAMWETEVKDMYRYCVDS